MKKSWPFVLSSLFVATVACTHQQHADRDGLNAILLDIQAERQPTRLQATSQRPYLTPPVLKASHSGSLLDRLRDGMGFSLEPSHDLIQKELSWHKDNPAYLPVVLERGERYLHHIIEELHKAGLPTELALLPIIESGFDPFAYSPSHAAGMWQFIPATGERFGLNRDWWWSGRRDVIDSTNAAMAYLKYLYDFFDGDWLLAVAAYNAGEGTVSQAVQRNRTEDKPTDFWSLDLPQQTQSYIPTLLALAEVVRNPRVYGVELPDIPDEPYFEIVELDGAINLQTAADLAGIDKEELLQLNPAVLRGTLSPDGPHRLLVPVQSRDHFLDSLEALPKADWMPLSPHVVSYGDTLSGIAQKYNTSVAAIQSANQLSGTRIRAGQHLQIPGTASDDDKADVKTNLTQQHVVKPGDSLWSIAQQFNLQIKDIMRWNQLNSRSILLPGQGLVLYLN